MSVEFNQDVDETKTIKGLQIIGIHIIKDLDDEDYNNVLLEYIDIHYKERFSDDTLGSKKCYRIEGEDLTALISSNPQVHLDVKTILSTHLMDELGISGTVV